MSSLELLGIIAAAIALILFLVMVVKLHAFVTLLIVSFGAGAEFRNGELVEGSEEKVAA